MKGLFYGLIAQFSFAVGLVFINLVNLDGEDLLKSNVVHLFAGILSIPLVIYLASAAPAEMKILGNGNWVYFIIGALGLFVLGDYFFIKGMSASNATMVSLTAMAFPVFAILLEYIVAQWTDYQTPTIQLRQVIGFFLLVLGFLLISMPDKS